MSSFFTLGTDGIFSIGTRDQIRSYLARHAGVEVEVDGVVFEDGQFVGPDLGKSFPEIAARFSARRSVYSAVMDNVRRGASGTQTLSELERTVERARSSTDYDHWVKVYAGELLRVANAQGVAEALKIAAEGVKAPLLGRGGIK